MSPSYGCSCASYCAPHIARPGPGVSALGPHRLRIPLDYLSGAGQVVGRTYDQEFAARSGCRSMAGRHVECIPRLENLLVIHISNCLRAFEHIAPVGTLTQIIWQPFEHRGQIRVLVNCDKADGITGQVTVAILPWP